MPVLSLADVYRARRRIEGRVTHTPLVASASLSRIAGTDVYLKLETMQPTGCSVRTARLLRTDHDGRLTVSDPEGVWLEVDRLGVRWRMGELFERRFHAEAIIADQVRIFRRPTLGPPPPPSSGISWKVTTRASPSPAPVSMAPRDVSCGSD